MASKKDKAPEATPAYEVRNTLTGAVEGRHDNKKNADREAHRLNKEAMRDGHRHLGRPVRFEVVTENGVVIPSGD